MDSGFARSLAPRNDNRLRSSGTTLYAVIVRRTIQNSRPGRSNHNRRGVLDHPPSRMTTVEVAAQAISIFNRK
jgi:hypothetical protein